MKIIALSGKMGVGKDYIADKLIARLHENKLDVERLAFADPLRTELDDIVRMIKCYDKPLTIAKKMQVSENEIRQLIKIFDTEPTFSRPDFSLRNRPLRYRELMQYWGTDVRRKHDKNYWTQKMINIITDNAPFVDVFVVTDVRFYNELKALLEFDNTFTVRINADEKLREQRVTNRDDVTPTESELNHVSELAMNDDDDEIMNLFDLVVVSTGNNGNEIVDKIMKNYNAKTNKKIAVENL